MHLNAAAAKQATAPARIATKGKWRSLKVEIKIYALGRDLIVTGDYQPYERTTLDYPGQSETFDITSVLCAHTRIKVAYTCDRHDDIIRRAVLDKIFTEQQMAETAHALSGYWGE